MTAAALILALALVSATTGFGIGVIVERNRRRTRGVSLDFTGFRITVPCDDLSAKLTNSQVRKSFRV